MSAYYCFDDSGALEAVVLEVSNMPWRQMHPYVLTGGTPIANDGLRFEFAKTFHVSPFMPLDMHYVCKLAPPGERLALALENWRDGARRFDAHLNFERIADQLRLAGPRARHRSARHPARDQPDPLAGAETMAQACAGIRSPQGSGCRMNDFDDTFDSVKIANPGQPAGLAIRAGPACRASATASTAQGRLQIEDALGTQRFWPGNRAYGH